MGGTQLAWILLFASNLHTDGQTLSETFTQVSECYGNTIQPSCSSGNVIAVDNVKIASKLSSSGCPADASVSSAAAACCTADEINDCVLSYTSDTTHQEACTGRETCTSTSVSRGANDGSTCSTTGFLDPTNYMIIDYYCIPSSRIFGVCSSVSETQTGTTLYLWNTRYGATSGANTILASETNCACSIEAGSCSSTINVYIIDARFENTAATCDQYIQVVDGESSNFTSPCSGAPFTVALLYPSTSNYLTFSLVNSQGSDGGNIWFGFKASSSTDSLTITCPSQARVQSCSSTTTTAVPTTTKTTDDSDSDLESWLRKNVFYVAFGGAAVLLISTLVGVFVYAKCIRKTSKVVPLKKGVW